MLEGHATAEGTAARTAGQADAEAVDLSGERLVLSSIGLGTRLGAADAETDAGYAASIRRALELGCDLLDAALVDRGQASERVIGRTLAELVAAGRLRRAEVVVCSKAGLVPRDRDAPERAKALLAGVPDEEVRDGHCLHPRFIESALARSRENLRLETIDVYCLHDPEAQLGRGPRAMFHERIRKAFTALEAARARGELRAYGVATWAGLRRPPGDAKGLELERLVEVARSVGGPDHGLRVVLLPVSLALPEALTTPTQRVGDATLPALEAIRRLGLVPVASGSLAQGELLRRPLPARAAALDPEGALGPAQRALQLVRSSGAAAALVGASKVEHVEQDLALLRRPRAPREAALAAAGASAGGAR